MVEAVVKSTPTCFFNLCETIENDDKTNCFGHRNNRPESSTG